MAGDGRAAERAPDDLLRAFADGVSAMVAYWDSDLRCRFANRAYERWFAVSRESMPGKHIRDLLGPKLFELNRPHIEGALRGERQEFEREIPDPAGGPPRHSLAQYVPDVVGGVVKGFFVLVTDITAVKRAELALKQSEARCSGIIAISADAIVSIDEDQRITLFNEGAERIFGWSREEVLGRALDILIPERFREEHARLVREFAASDVRTRKMANERATIRGLRKNGQEFAAEANLSRFMVGHRAILTAALRDVSEALRASEQLRDSEERFRLTIDEAPIGMALVALDGRFIRVNRALCEIVGYAQEELTGLTFQAITHPEDLETDVALAQKLARNEIPRYQLEKRYVRKDGSIVWIMLHGSAVRDPSGAPRYYVAQIEDVSERRRVERERQFMADAGALLASSLDFDETLAAVARLAVQGIADWCIVDIAEDETIHRRVVTGADPGKAELAARFERAHVDRTRPYLLRPVVETRKPLFLARVEARDLEMPGQSPEYVEALHALAPASVIGVPLLARGRFLGSLAFLTGSPGCCYDESHLGLAVALAERAAIAIENAILYRTALEATQLREQVLGIVAHDLRNPLNAIILQASLLRRTGPDPERRSMKPVDMIEKAARRTNRLIEDLLDVSRMEAGELALERQRLSAAQLASDVVAAQLGLATSGSRELRLELAPNLTAVWGDRDRILQVFENLIGNAIKFTKPGGRITVGAEPRGGAVLFRVSDSGIGIAAEDLPRVFDRFWQAKRSERAGAGLGLAIARGIVESHGGKLWVESTRGVGSTFFFTVPTAPAAARSGPQRRAA